ncbi:MAG: hypothetical protein H0U02_13335 [Rubrobacter sp.]|nr:hypothetical protein [Rubrobacter sp.]
MFAILAPDEGWSSGLAESGQEIRVQSLASRDGGLALLDPTFSRLIHRQTSDGAVGISGHEAASSELRGQCQGEIAQDHGLPPVDEMSGMD